MRKISVLLLIVISIFGTAFAESEFTFRNGISIGMSYEQVIAAEGREPDEIVNYSVPQLIYFDDVDISRFKAKYIAYCFSEGKLKSAFYCIEKPFNSKTGYLIDAMSSVYGPAQSCSGYEAGFAVSDNTNADNWYSAYRWNVGSINIYLALDEYQADRDRPKKAYIIYAAAADCNYDITML